MGCLGGGNHSLNALALSADDRFHLGIRTGSRGESDLVETFVDEVERFSVTGNTGHLQSVHESVHELLTNHPG